MMKPRHIFISIIFVLIIAVMIVMATSGSLLPGTGTSISPTSDVRKLLVERTEAQIDTSVLPDSSPEPVETQVESQDDGQALLQRECSECHAINLLLEIKKSRVEWEKTLSFMNGMGVHMDEAEEGILLEYLSAAETQ